MHPILLLITGLVVLPLLFPEQILRRLIDLQSQLDNRHAAQDREIEHLHALVDTHREWADWLAQLRRDLAQASEEESRSTLLIQGVAAGQRFLTNTDPSASPHLHRRTQALCRTMQAELAGRTQSKKRGQA